MFFVASPTVLTLSRIEFWVKPKVVGVNTLASKKLVGVGQKSVRCYGLQL